MSELPRVPRFDELPSTRGVRLAAPVQFFRWSGGPIGIDEPGWASDAIVTGKLRPWHGMLMIETPSGTLKAVPGDWIVRETDGTLYPCKPSVFALAFRPAETGAPEATDPRGTPS